MNSSLFYTDINNRGDWNLQSWMETTTLSFIRIHDSLKIIEKKNKRIVLGKRFDFSKVERVTFIMCEIHGRKELGKFIDKRAERINQ